MNQNSSDFEIIHNCLNGDINSFEILMQRYQDYVYAVALRMTANCEDAKDITQDIFLKVFDMLPMYNLKYEFKPWLYKISVNTTIDYLRKNKKRNINFDFTNNGHEPVLKEDPFLDKLDLSSQIEIVYAAINKLSNKYREVVLLKYIEGLEDEEIASFLGISNSTVRVRLMRARELLKKYIYNNS